VPIARAVAEIVTEAHGRTQQLVHAYLARTRCSACRALVACERRTLVGMTMVYTHNITYAPHRHFVRDRNAAHRLEGPVVGDVRCLPRFCRVRHTLEGAEA